MTHATDRTLKLREHCTLDSYVNLCRTAKLQMQAFLSGFCCRPLHISLPCFSQCI